MAPRCFERTLCLWCRSCQICVWSEETSENTLTYVHTNQSDTNVLDGQCLAKLRMCDPNYTTTKAHSRERMVFCNEDLCTVYCTYI